MAVLQVMPRERRSASISACSASAQGCTRQPPNAGPSRVLCSATIALRPDAVNMGPPWAARCLLQAVEIGQQVVDLLGCEGEDRHLRMRGHDAFCQGFRQILDRVAELEIAQWWSALEQAVVRV